MNSPQESDAEGEIDPDYAHTGWATAIDPLLASGEAPPPAAPTAYGYYPPTTEYYAYPAAEETAAFYTTNNPYLEEDAVRNPYMEEDAAHNPYLESPPPAAHVEPLPGPETQHQPPTNRHSTTTHTQQDHEADPLLLVPTATKPATRPAKAERARPQPRARSSATPIPGPNARRKPTSPAAGPSTITVPKPKESKKASAPTTTATPSASTPGPGPARGAVVRDELCSFCRGTDAKNKAGYMEKMLTCEKCGRSGHPSCLSFTSPHLRAQVKKYAWQCIECKVCEICHVKGEDSRLMFCDGCDRGWHSYCLDPPLGKPPRGIWKCPLCLGEPVPKPLSERPKKPAPAMVEPPPPAPAPVERATSNGKRSNGKREDASSVASGSVRSRGKGKAKAAGQGGGVSPSVPMREEPRPSSPLRPRSPTVDTPRPHELVDTPVPVEGSRSKRPRVIEKLRLVTSSVRDTPVRRGTSPPVVVVQDATPTPAPPRPSTIIKIKLPQAMIRERDRKKRKRSPAAAAALALEEEEDDEEPFGGIIKGEDADTTRTAIQEEDKIAFEHSRTAAEALLGAKREQEDAASEAGRLDSPATSIDANPTHAGSRALRERVLISTTIAPLMSRSDSNGTASGVAAEKIKAIRIGKYDIDTWYSAPYPEEYSRVPDGRLWLCEYCLKYMKSGFVAGRHEMKCKARHPPGDEIYRDGNISVFEVDGRKNKIYCQNLCLLAKMFLDHKTLYYDVEPFLFYVMTENDDEGAKFVGYFSKEKRSPNLNVSCIMTLPVRQRKGWGNLLIDFSYLLSKKECRTGTPEKPLSALGALSYRNYWTLSVFKFLDKSADHPTLQDISKGTSMTLEDILATLQHHGMIHIDDNPDELAARRRQESNSKRSTTAGGGMARKALSRNADRSQTTVIPEHYEILWDRQAVREHLERYATKGHLELKPEHLKYTPFLVTRITLGKDGMLHTLAMAKGQAVEVQGKEPDLVSALVPVTASSYDTNVDNAADPNPVVESMDVDQNAIVADNMPMDVDTEMPADEISLDLAPPAEPQTPNSSIAPVSPLRPASVTSTVSRKRQRTHTPSVNSTPRARRSAQQESEIASNTLTPIRSSRRSGASSQL